MGGGAGPGANARTSPRCSRGRAAGDAAKERGPRQLVAAAQTGGPEGAGGLAGSFAAVQDVPGGCLSSENGVFIF